MVDLSDLITRVTNASGPDRELDRLIATTFGWYQVETNIGRDWRDPQGYSRLIPHFTASIDAALTLLPGGWIRSVDASAPDLGIDVELYGPNEQEVMASHDDERLALLAAILMARQAKEARE